MDVVFSVCIVRRGAVGARIWEVCVFSHALCCICLCASCGSSQCCVLHDLHCTTTNSDGESMEQWADSNSLSLIHNAKLPKSFNIAIWNKGYNTDLIFVSSNISDMCEKSVLDPIPRT